MAFEKSMAETVKGIQSASNEVSEGAEQVVASSNDLAEGATNQAGSCGRTDCNCYKRGRSGGTERPVCKKRSVEK